jgi:hypothetical protein
MNGQRGRPHGPTPRREQPRLLCALCGSLCELRPGATLPPLEPLDAPLINTIGALIREWRRMDGAGQTQGCSIQYHALMHGVMVAWERRQRATEVVS